MNKQVIQELLEKLVRSGEEAKAIKKAIREIETDYPMELEDLLASRKELSAQIKERKGEFEKDLLENNVEYGELRERLQLSKEEKATAQLELFAAAANLAREHGDIDETVMIEGTPQRLQTQKDVNIFLNGKQVKA